jgi:hypothetical protein
VVKHFQDDPNPPPFIKALAEVRHLAAKEGWCYQNVQSRRRALASAHPIHIHSEPDAWLHREHGGRKPDWRRHPVGSAC